MSDQNILANNSMMSKTDSDKEKPKLVLNSKVMIEKLKENQTIQAFCTSEIKKITKFNGNGMVMISNYTFLLRLLGIHLLLVGLIKTPGL